MPIKRDGSPLGSRGVGGKYPARSIIEPIALFRGPSEKHCFILATSRRRKNSGRSISGAARSGKSGGGLPEMSVRVTRR
jgi:hypothetical protein